MVPHPNFSPMCLLALTVTLMYTLPAPAAANYEHYCDSATFRIQRNGQCGESLANTILSLCRALSNSFVGKYMMKKRTPAKGAPEKRLSDISLTKSDAFSYLAKRQSSQNVVCECCVNRCGITEMFQYCELPPLTFKRRIRGDNDDSSPLQKDRRHHSNLEDSDYKGST